MRFISVIGLALALALAPDSAQAQANGITVTIPVPKVTIFPGDVLSGEVLGDLKVVLGEKATGMYITSRAAVIDKVARRTLRAGAAIPVNALRDPYAFKDGQRVEIVFGAAGLSIRGAGVAIEPGIVGSSAAVRNLDTGVVVRGLVQADGSVLLGGG